MKIAIIGATGFIGSTIVKEALERDHHVTAISRNPKASAISSRLDLVSVDVADVDLLAQTLKGHDAIVLAYNSGHGNPEQARKQVEATQSMIAAVKKSGVKRVVMVGGAGTLEISPGLQLVDSKDFPKEYLQAATGTRDAYNLLRIEETLDWTVYAPAGMIAPGKKTGKARIGDHRFLVDDKGQSNISVEDYAMLMMDEVESPKHIKKMFTAAY
jgi:putative NADH-flavin reductase